MLRFLTFAVLALLRMMAAAAVTTRKGKDVQSGRMYGTTPTQAPPINISWGYNPATLTAAATDVALFQEGAEARTAGTPSQVTTTSANDTFQVTGSITATGTRTVAEVALYDSTTQPSQATVTTGATSIVGSSTNTNLYTTATFSPGTGYVQIRTEVLHVTAGSGSTALTVVRGQNGSTAISTIAAADPVGQGNIPGTTTTAGGSTLLHADHSADGLSSGDSISYTISVQYE